MKIIIAPDKFKGSLTAFEVCNAIEAGLLQAGVKAAIQQFPLADGGDGFASVMQYYLHTTTVSCATVDPLHRPMQGSYQWSGKKRIAIIELAVASGIALLKQHELNPMQTSTYGTGLLIKDALQKGAQKIILGIGGSATNDAGMGILSALGFRFLDADQQVIYQPAGKDLSAIKSIEAPPHLPQVEWNICCDVSNPFSGTNGAAYVYGPQKGADEALVKVLDNGLKNFATVLTATTGNDITHVPGAGAAGGVAGGLMALLGATLTSGIDMVIETSGLLNELLHADVVITGEGKLDDQSLQGKVVGTVASLAQNNHVPCTAYCGVLTLSSETLNDAGVQNAFCITPHHASLEESMLNAALFLKQKVAETGRLFLP